MDKVVEGTFERNRPTLVGLVASPEHAVSDHPENPQRFDQLAHLIGELPPSKFEQLEPRPVNDEHLLRVHPASYLAALRQACAQGPAIIDYAPTFVTTTSYEDALMAAGTAVEIAADVWRRRVEAGFALVRPPGHHATANRAMGFCLLNNIAVAARHVQSLGCDRLMVVDIDVHHGNGSQAIFNTDPSVLYLSTHQAGIYPGTGGMDETGEGEGAGMTVNLPLPPSAGDAALLDAVQQVAIPMALRFEPQMILVSAGFDTHWRDPLANLLVTCSGVYRVVQLLVELADAVCEGRICLSLEGGYDPQALAGCIRSALHAIAGLPEPPDPLGPAPRPETNATRVIAAARDLHGL